MGLRSRLSCDCGSGFKFRGAAEAFDVDAELAEGGEAAEEAHFEDAGLSGIDFGESVEGVVG